MVCKYIYQNNEKLIYGANFRPYTYNVESWLVPWVGIVSSFSKIIQNLCKWLGGPVLCQVFFWGLFFSACFFHFWIFFILWSIINQLFNEYLQLIFAHTKYMYIKYVCCGDPSIVSSCCQKKQLFKVVTHQQDWSSIVRLLWWSSIVSSCCLGWKFSNIPFTLSFAKAFCFYFVSFFWDCQKCAITQNIWRLIKTQLINQHPDNFSRG